ncbi:30S ribosomal protein S2, partial [Candidatus Falkowbacteria bacterium]|nr:30S ribosomal protein S2 [Candidatus Falkowbacteria bacterium]
GTKEQANNIVKKAAQNCSMPYVTNHWVGGLITNFREIQTRIKHLKKLEDDKERGKLKKYTKKEQADFDDEIKKLNNMFGGLKKIEKAPDAIFIVDLKREKTAVREARKKDIPIIAMVDTNVNPELAAYPIPANDDAVKCLELIINSVSEAIKEGGAAVDKGGEVDK